MKIRNLVLISPFLFLLIFTSCDKKEVLVSKNKIINNFIHSVMRDDKYYLWYDQAPDVAADESEPADYLKALTYKDKDKWSFILDTTQYNSFVSGKYYGYGFSYRWYSDNTLRVALVFTNSPIDKAGIKRGFRILEVNGKTVEYIDSNKLWGTIFGDNKNGAESTLKLIDNEGNTITKTIQKEEVIQNTVINKKVVTLNDNSKVGYLYFHSFMTESGEKELKEAFTYFKSEGVTKLIIDLRYNGGGSLNTAINFGGLIKGNENENSKFLTLQHNKYHSDKDNIYKMPKITGGISGIKKVIFITTKSSASASEIMINCMKPYVDDVKVIGDVTDGKPVGMEGAFDKETGMILFAITFKTVNALGEGDYYNGITPDAYRSDDLTQDFGSVNEACMKEALFYLNNGRFNQINAKKSEITHEQPEFTGVQRIYSAY